MLVLNLPASENKNKKLMIVPMETVSMMKSRPGKNQSGCSDLPQDYLAIIEGTTRITVHDELITSFSFHRELF